ncbi:hypothetical protein [Streptomyces sp. R35]|uniref:Uncharacterized protein n=1 Tax=Streptomyces sp. R35 TaxID=3238630 RepID=A0AB39SJ06_9ACTN
MPDEAEQLLVTGGVNAGRDPAQRVASRRSRPRDLVVLTDDNDGRWEPRLPGRSGLSVTYRVTAEASGCASSAARTISAGENGLDPRSRSSTNAPQVTPR